MYQNIPDADKMEIPKDLFKDIKYYIVGNIDEKVESILNAGGGRRDHYLSEMCSHAIADDPTEPDCNEAKELFELPVVTSRWVVLSAKCGILLPTEGFCPDENALFNGLVFCPSQLAAHDASSTWALINYNGGECQAAFDPNVTHLVASKPGGPKYESAINHPDVKIVTPDWISTCIAHNGLIDETRFHPRLLQYEVRAPTPPPVEQPMETESPKTPSVKGVGTPPRTPAHQTYTPKAGASAAYHYHPNSPRNQPQSPKGQTHTNSRTKEALARMVSNRIGQTSPGPLSPGRSGSLSPRPHPGSPERAGPHPGMLRMPGAPQGPGSRGMRSPRGMLRNITNDGTRLPRSPRSPRGRGSRGPRGGRGSRGGRGATKINQIMGLGSGRGRGGQHMYGVQQIAMQQHMMQQQPPQQPVYHGHDPIENIPPAACLLGCVFYVTDYQKYVEKNTLDMWKKVIEDFGGQVDESYSNRVTHVMCENQKSDVFQLALRDGKRLVTAHWLNDTLLKKKLLPPWLALHFPLMWSHNDKPCTDQIVCVTNFQGEERVRLKHMLASLGAKYTGYMSRAHSVVVAKRPEGSKYSKAVEWRIPVVNVTWLNDMLLGDLTPLKLPVASRFLHYADDPFKLDQWRVSHLMEGWKTPVRIPKEAWKKFHATPRPQASSGATSLDIPAAPGGAGITEAAAGGVKRKAEEELQQGAEKKIKSDENTPPPLAPGDGPVVLITGVPKSRASQLNKEIEKLGGRVTTSHKGATHLVARSIARTVKFLTGLSVVKHVVSPEWIERSAQEGRFLAEGDFVLQDAVAEAEFGFNFTKSLENARSRKVFADLSFYVTPEVMPNKSTLRDIIESAGGKILDKMPRITKIREMKNSKGEDMYITITCDTDLYMMKNLTARDIAVHTAEFILTGVMKQEIDYSAYRLA